MTTPPQHSDEELHKIVHRVLQERHGAMWNVQAPDGTELYEDTYENALVAELKKREAAAYKKGAIDEILGLFVIGEHGRVIGPIDDNMREIDKRLAQLHKEQPDTTPCMCNHNPETGLRLDIVCPVHDSPASP